MVTPARRLVRLAGAVLATSTLVACSGSAGVEVSHDWSGVSGYLVADVNGLTTIVGVDTERNQARSLVVIPERGHDDDVTSPTLARGASGDTLLVRPTDLGAGTLYRVRRDDAAAERIGSITDGAGLYPWSGGWVEVSPSSSGATVRLLTEGLEEQSVLTLPVRPDVVAPDANGSLCVAENQETDARALVVDLRRRKVGSVTPLTETVSVLACPGGQLLVGGSDAPEATSAGVPEVRLVSGRGRRTLGLSGGRLDAILTDRDHAYVVAGSGSSLHALVVDLATGEVLRKARLGDLQAVDDAFLDAGHLVVADERSVAVLDLSGNEDAASFRLPGRVYPG